MRKVLDSKLQSGKVFKAITTWVVSVVRCSAVFFGWSRGQLQEIDRTTRKLLRPSIIESLFIIIL